MTLGALPEVLRFSDQYRGVLNGMVLLLVILFLPKGIVGIPGMIMRMGNSGSSSAEELE